MKSNKIAVLVIAFTVVPLVGEDHDPVETSSQEVPLQLEIVEETQQQAEAMQESKRQEEQQQESKRQEEQQQERMRQREMERQQREREIKEAQKAVLFFEDVLNARQAMLQEAQAWVRQIEELRSHFDLQQVRGSEEAITKIQADIESKQAKINQIPEALIEIKKGLMKTMRLIWDLFEDEKTDIVEVDDADKSSAKFLTTLEKYIEKLKVKIDAQQKNAVAPEPYVFEMEQKRYRELVEDFDVIKDQLYEAKDFNTMIDRTIDLYDPTALGMLPLAKKNLQMKIEKAIKLAQEIPPINAQFNEQLSLVVNPPNKKDIASLKKEIKQLEKNHREKWKRLAKLKDNVIDLEIRKKVLGEIYDIQLERHAKEKEIEKLEKKLSMVVPDKKEMESLKKTIEERSEEFNALVQTINQDVQELRAIKENLMYELREARTRVLGERKLQEEIRKSQEKIGKKHPKKSAIK